MISKKYLAKIMPLALAAVVVVSSFAACSSGDGDGKKGDDASKQNNKTMTYNSDSLPENPVTTLKEDSKYLTPDTSSVKLDPPSTSVRSCSTEEECIEALKIFANPNGNEYDALSVLGKFRYANRTEDDMMNKLKNASSDWHKTVTDVVGEKCVVDMAITKKTTVELSDAKVTDWNAANGKTAEAYTNVKCTVSTNYADNQLTISFDLVKADGSWYLANTSTLNKIQNVIVHELFV